MLTSQEFLRWAVHLPEAQRVELIESLLATLDPARDEPDAAAQWLGVACERAAELDSGAVSPISWEVVREEGERRIHGRPSP